MKKTIQRKKKRKKNLYPKSIYKVLDEHIVGQEEAKKIISAGIYNHYKRLESLQKEPFFPFTAPAYLQNNIVASKNTFSTPMYRLERQASSQKARKHHCCETTTVLCISMTRCSQDNTSAISLEETLGATFQGCSTSARLVMPRAMSTTAPIAATCMAFPATSQSWPALCCLRKLWRKGH